MVVDPSTRFSLKENHGSESFKAQELLMNLHVSPKLKNSSLKPLRAKM